MIKIFEKYMMLIGSSSSLVFYLQAYKVIIKKSASDVSLLAFSIGLISVSSWLLYGILIKNKVLVVSNLFAVIGASLAVMSVLFYA